MDAKCKEYITTGNKDKLIELIYQCEDINTLSSDKTYCFPLTYACKTSNYDIVELCLNAGADPMLRHPTHGYPFEVFDTITSDTKRGSTCHADEIVGIETLHNYIKIQNLCHGTDDFGKCWSCSELLHPEELYQVVKLHENPAETEAFVLDIDIYAKHHLQRFGF